MIRFILGAFFCISILLTSFPNQFYAVSNENDMVDKVEQQEIDIATSPQKMFFNLSNLKPGDRVTKVLTVYNNGKQDFNYLFSNRFLTGSKNFYDELLLTVSDEHMELYKGKLRAFSKIDARFLENGNVEKIYITVEIPFELGNEYQGLGSEFQFKLYVEGTLGGVIPVDGPKLPNTATGIFNLIGIGAALIIGGIALLSIMKKRKREIELT